VIEPRADRDITQRDKLNMPFRGVYWEWGLQSEAPLREEGFKLFPVLAPRWEVVGRDIYGRSPAMDALGDSKALQSYEYNLGNAFDYLARPPLMAHESLKNRLNNLKPGGISFYGSAMMNQGELLKTAYDMRIDPKGWQEVKQEIVGRINSALFKDLFMMLSQFEAGQMTATEVMMRQQEKMLMLGPVVERLTHELCGPLIEITFGKLLEAKLLPMPPQELQGQSLQVDYKSILVQAQQQAGLAGMDRFVTVLGEVAQLNPQALDNVDVDKLVNRYADDLDVPPDCLLASDQVAVVRQQRQAAMQRQQQQEQLQAGADAAAKLGNIPTGNGTVGGVLAKHLGVQ